MTNIQSIPLKFSVCFDLECDHRSNGKVDFSKGKMSAHLVVSSQREDENIPYCEEKLLSEESSFDDKHDGMHSEYVKNLLFERLIESFQNALKFASKNAKKRM